MKNDSGLEPIFAAALVILILLVMSGCGDVEKIEAQGTTPRPVTVTLGACVAQVDGIDVVVTCEGAEPVRFPLECQDEPDVSPFSQLQSDMWVAMCIVEILEINGIDW